MAQSERKKKSKKLLISVMFMIVMIVITLYVILKDFELKEIINVLDGIELKYIGYSLLMIVLYISFGGWALKSAMKSLKHNIKFKASVVYASIDYFFSGITPSATGGQPVQVFYMKKDRIPLLTSTISALINTIMYKVVLMILGIIVFVFFPEILADSGTIGLILFILGFVINAIVVVICFMGIYWRSLISKIGHLILKLLAKFKIIKNLDDKILYFENKLDEYSKIAHYLNENKFIGVKLFFINFLQRISLFLVTYFVYMAMPLATHDKSLYYLIAIQIFVALSVDSLPFPGGVGISEVLLTALFAGVYPGEATLASALLLTRGVYFYFTILLTGAIFFANHIRLMIKSKKRNVSLEEYEEEPSQEEVVL